jgi:Grx4 family monothiol glutaredoxin
MAPHTARPVPCYAAWPAAPARTTTAVAGLAGDRAARCILAGRRAFTGARPRAPRVLAPPSLPADAAWGAQAARMSILDFNVPEGAAAGIENLPLEPVPAAGSPLPLHWARPGVYGVYGADGTLNYVAAVLDVADAVDGHRRVIADPDLVHSVRMMTVDKPDDAPLGTLAQNWLVAHTRDGPGAPVGNTEDGADWRVVQETEPKGGNVYFREGTTEKYAELEIKRILREHKVVLFMKGTQDSPRCGFSNGVLSILRSKLNAENFACVDVLDSSRNVGLRDEIKRYSDWPTIPQLYVNGDFVGGADIVASLNDTGELAEMLEVAEVPLRVSKPRA